MRRVRGDEPREEDAFQLRLNEKLRIEEVRRRVERCSGNGNIDSVRGGDRVRRQECDNLGRSEGTGVVETSQDGVNRIERLGHRQIGSGPGSIRTTEEEVQARGSRAIGDANSTGELDEIARSDAPFRNEGLLSIDDVVDTACVKDALGSNKT